MQERDLFEWIPSRSFRQGLVNMTFLGLPMHYWMVKVVPCFTVSQKLLPNPVHNKIATVILRIGVHSAFMLPYMQVALLFGLGMFKTASVQSGQKLVTEKFSEAWHFALVFWPFIYIGLYTVVPVQFSLLYMDFFRIIWQSLASLVANKHPGDELPSWPMLFRKLTGQKSVKSEP